jgi:hypothetical protein
MTTEVSLERHKFLNASGLYGFLAHNQKISIPSNINDIYIDVGLSGDAPNSALWLINDSAYCIGIEPLALAWRLGLFCQTMKGPDEKEWGWQEWPIIQLYNHSVMYKGKRIADISNRFAAIQCAIANQNEPSMKTFYLNSYEHGESGSSSLLHPSERPLQFLNRPNIFDREITVPCCSLQYIIDYIDWPNCKPITHIKTDVEGTDFDAIKSAGHHLERTIFVSAEWNHNSSESVKKMFYSFMCDLGFSVHRCEGGNIDFSNNRYNEMIKARGLTCRTHGL